MHIRSVMVAIVACAGVSACQTVPFQAAADHQWDGRYEGDETFVNLGAGNCIPTNGAHKIYLVKNNRLNLIVGASKETIIIDTNGYFYSHISTLELHGQISGNVLDISSSNGNCIFKDHLIRTTAAYNSAALATAKPAPLPPTSPAVIAVAHTPVTGDTPQKLRMLKSLFDQQLISASEYDTRRTAILDGVSRP